jgi:aryl-alcohol dehydrogenase-like predicted oxidoreductase
VNDTLIEIGKKQGKTPAQVALNWLIHQPGVTTAVLGARTLDQLRENLGSIGWKLSDEEMNKIHTASEIPEPYPYRFINRYTRRRDPA